MSNAIVYKYFHATQILICFSNDRWKCIASTVSLSTVKKRKWAKIMLTLIWRWTNLHSLGMTHSMTHSDPNDITSSCSFRKREYFQHAESVNFFILSLTIWQHWSAQVSNLWHHTHLFRTCGDDESKPSNKSVYFPHKDWGLHKMLFTYLWHPWMLLSHAVGSPHIFSKSAIELDPRCLNFTSLLQVHHSESLKRVRNLLVHNCTDNIYTVQQDSCHLP